MLLYLFMWRLFQIPMKENSQEKKIHFYTLFLIYIHMFYCAANIAKTGWLRDNYGLYDNCIIVSCILYTWSIILLCSLVLYTLYIIYCI